MLEIRISADVMPCATNKGSGMCPSQVPPPPPPPPQLISQVDSKTAAFLASFAEGCGNSISDSVRTESHSSEAYGKRCAICKA